MRISDWSSDVCSSDLVFPPRCLPARSAAKLLLPGQDLFMRPLVGEVVAVLDHGQQHRALALDHLYIGTAELRPAAPDLLTQARPVRRHPIPVSRPPRLSRGRAAERWPLLAFSNAGQGACP